jgi:hypothetical protein
MLIFVEGGNWRTRRKTLEAGERINKKTTPSVPSKTY